MPWIKLDPSATATRASNEHLALSVVALIAGWHRDAGLNAGTVSHG
jgi:hypothetical protein